MLDWIKTKTSKIRKDFGQFSFYVKSEPQYIDSGTTLSLTCYSSVFQNSTIPCVYRWSMIRNGRKVQRPEFRGNCFKCQPSDVGAIIQAEVISTDLENEGTAIIQFGPVRLDTNLRKQVQAALKSASTFMSAHVTNGIQERQCQINMSQDIVKINHVYSKADFAFDYSPYEPTAQCLTIDSNRLIIRFSSDKHYNQLRRFKDQLFEDPFKNFGNSTRSTQMSQVSGVNSNSLQIKFLNHKARDIFVFVWKAFTTKKQLRSSIVINRLQKMNSSFEENLDYVLEIQRLKNDSIRLQQDLKRAHQQKIRHISQINQLKHQIETIVLSYTGVAEQKRQTLFDLSRDFSDITLHSGHISTQKYQKLENENNHLNSRIDAITKQIDMIRFQPHKLPPANFPSESVLSPTSSLKVVSFKAENIKSPFSKKKTQDDSQAFINFFEDLSSSRISYASEISSIRQNPELKEKLEQTEKQRDTLKNKLQMSFHKIADLQKQIYLDKLGFSGQVQRKNQSAINLDYKPSGNNSISFTISPLNKTSNSQHERKHLFNTNFQLKTANDVLITQNRSLADDLKRSQQIINQQKHISKSQSFYQLNLSSVSSKTEKKEPIFNNQQKQLLKLLIKKDKDISNLNFQIERLQMQNQRLNQLNLSIKGTQTLNQILQRKIDSLQQQLHANKRNQEALNRSQQLSLEMTTFNDQQILMLKKHNEFLINQNNKLSKACQKYMNEAKECNKLRTEIMNLRERIMNQKQF